MTTVALSGITVRYEPAGPAAVDGVSISVADGELLCLVGPSGCGKTTLLKTISGLIQPETGTVLFNGEDVTCVPPEERRAVMVFQNHLLFPFLSILQNVGFGLRMRGYKRDEWEPRARKMLADVKLEGFAERRPASLSAGQRQRAALARALLAEPRVLLLDEPLSNLDRHLRGEMRQAIIELQRSKNVTTICVTHDQEEAVLLGDRIAMLSEGRLVQVGEAEAFYERPHSVAVGRFFGNHNQIMGTRKDCTVITDLGLFTLEGCEHKDWPDEGPVCIHIRPESIELSPSLSSSENTIVGRIIHRVYVGTHMRYVVDVSGIPWQVVAGPLAQRFAEGDEAVLRLPAERIWLTRD